MVINFNPNKLEFVTKLLGVNPISSKVFDEHSFNRALKKVIYRELLSSYEVFRRQGLEHIQTSINNEIIRCCLCKKVGEQFDDYAAHSVGFGEIVEENCLNEDEILEKYGSIELHRFLLEGLEQARNAYIVLLNIEYDKQEAKLKGYTYKDYRAQCGEIWFDIDMNYKADKGENNA